MREETIPVRCIDRTEHWVSMVARDPYRAGYIYAQTEFDRMDFYPRRGMRFAITVEIPDEDDPLDELFRFTIFGRRLVGVSSVIDCT